MLQHPVMFKGRRRRHGRRKRDGGQGGTLGKDSRASPKARANPDAMCESPKGEAACLPGLTAQSHLPPQRHLGTHRELLSGDTANTKPPTGPRMTCSRPKALSPSWMNFEAREHRVGLHWEPNTLNAALAKRKTRGRK